MEGGERWRCDRGQGAGEEVSLRVILLLCTLQRLCSPSATGLA